MSATQPQVEIKIACRCGAVLEAAHPLLNWVESSHGYTCEKCGQSYWFAAYKDNRKGVLVESGELIGKSKFFVFCPQKRCRKEYPVAEENVKEGFQVRCVPCGLTHTIRKDPNDGARSYTVETTTTNEEESGK